MSSSIVFCNKSRYKTGKSLHTSCYPAALLQLPILRKYYGSVDQVTCEGRLGLLQNLNWCELYLRSIVFDQTKPRCIALSFGPCMIQFNVSTSTYRCNNVLYLRGVPEDAEIEDAEWEDAIHVRLITVIWFWHVCLNMPVTTRPTGS
jgi:hypothetical protein